MTADSNFPRLVAIVFMRKKIDHTTPNKSCRHFLTIFVQQLRVRRPQSLRQSKHGGGRGVPGDGMAHPAGALKGTTTSHHAGTLVPAPWQTCGEFQLADEL